MKAIIPAIVILIVLYGCCCAMTPPSSGPSTSFSYGGSCPYGTYGESCTRVCQANPGIPNCFNTCMDGVRSEGLGDATTCCPETVRMQCDSMCTDLESRTEGDTTKAECMDECLGTYQAVNAPLDICAMPL
jgi:hypothetical protein